MRPPLCPSTTATGRVNELSAGPQQHDHSSDGNNNKEAVLSMLDRWKGAVIMEAGDERPHTYTSTCYLPLTHCVTSSYQLCTLF